MAQFNFLTLLKSFFKQKGTCIFTFFFCTITLLAQEPNLSKSILQGTGISQPTSLEFGVDGKLYISERFGKIWQFTISRDDADPGKGVYTVDDSRRIDNIVNETLNHTDQGIVNFAKERQVTGIATAGTAQNPVLYVSSSDAQTGGDSRGDVNLDTNSGILSKLTWNGIAWEKIDLIRGLPRCEENHASNGMDLFTRNGTSYLLLQQGGHANQGAPSNKFAGTPEYFLSGALLIINLTQLEGMKVYTDPRSNTKYVYDLPTLNDPDRRDITNADANFPYPSGHPLYNATIDIGDPFGGNDSFNQAFTEPNGPVQIFAPGFRNAFDVVIKEDGKIYTVDNGPNGTWGGLPIIYNDGKYKGNQNEVGYNPSQGDYLTNEFEINTGVSHGDGLHYVGTIDDTNGTYYGGHPNPIAAFPTRAGIIKYNQINGTWKKIAQTDLATTLNGVSGYFKSSFTTADFPDNPRIGKHLAGKINSPEVNIIDIYSQSTNGLCEYTASTFNGKLKGQLLTVSYDGNIRKFKIAEDGVTIVDKKDNFISAGGTPLDITSVGDNRQFAGTVWVASIFSNQISVFEPDNTICIATTDPLYDPLADYDSDGYSNQDEIDNGTNYCSAGNAPADFDKDFISDLNDSDDDNDGIADAIDAFAIDPTNGLSTDLPIDRPFWNYDPGTGFFGLGFMGIMTNPSTPTDYLSQFDTKNMSFGGAAGKASIDFIAKTTALGNTNNQEYAFQLGVNVDRNSDRFTVKSRVESPFFAVGGNPKEPIENQAIGIYIGTGDQDNYLAIQLQKGTTENDGIGGIQVLLETDGIPESKAIVDVPGILLANNLDLYLTVDPASNTAQTYISVDAGNTIQTIGSPVTLPESFLNPLDDQGLAIGLLASADGATAPPFAAAWDYLTVTQDKPGEILAQSSSVSFGVIAINAKNVRRSLVLKNESGPGDPIIDITNVFVEGSDSELFMSTTTVPFSIGSGFETTIPIDVRPDGSVGLKNAVLVVEHTGINSPLRIPLDARFSDKPLRLYFELTPEVLL